MTIGDVTVDEFLRLNNRDAALLCDIHREKCRISFDFGEKIPVEDYLLAFGGSALNTAVGFSRLGLKTSISGICGEDDDSRKLIDFLKNEEVETSHLIKEGVCNRSSIIIFKNERTIFSYHAKREYAKLTLPKTDWIYLASATEGSEILVEKIALLIKFGAKLVINPGSWELRNFDKFKRIAKESILIILNKSEADMIVGEGKPKEQLEKIHALGAKIAVITDGKNGAYASAAGRAIHLGIFASEPVDTTGAGDSFSCGFVAGMIYSQSLDEAMKWGMANSASVVEKVGANDGLMSKSAIEKTVKSVWDKRCSEI